MKQYTFHCTRNPQDTLGAAMYFAEGEGPLLFMATRNSGRGSFNPVMLSVEDAKKLKKAINKFLKEAEPQ